MLLEAILIRNEQPNGSLVLGLKKGFTEIFSSLLIEGDLK